MSWTRLREASFPFLPDEVVTDPTIVDELRG
jgi:hypothetical protein